MRCSLSRQLVLICTQAISWTGGFGPKNYTSLSAIYLQTGLANADAAQMLPYLTGSQPVVAYQYTEDVLAYASVLPVPTVLTLITVLLLGFASAFFVPRLPLNIPRRDFGYGLQLSDVSWN